MKILEEIIALENKAKAKHLMGFFKTGKGQYGEGDLFLGITVPITRSIAKKYYQNTSLEEIQELIKNEYHEVRLLALLLLVFIYKKSENKEEIFTFYLNNIKYINNWDLVDLSCPSIIGDFVYKSKDSKVLYQLAEQDELWANRISVVSTLFSIRKGGFSDILKLSKSFLNHEHDLMHKAVGWMLREMGKVDEIPLYDFLNSHSADMPRTMLRYSIERLPEDKRLYYLHKDSNKGRNRKVKQR